VPTSENRGGNGGIVNFAFQIQLTKQYGLFTRRSQGGTDISGNFSQNQAPAKWGGGQFDGKKGCRLQGEFWGLHPFAPANGI